MNWGLMKEAVREARPGDGRRRSSFAGLFCEEAVSFAAALTGSPSSCSSGRTKK
jgi:hypothetical protein